MYNILWIDDEHESLSGTKGRAKRNGINLIPYKSLNGGMSELERNYPFYDGVLFDAKFFENENDLPGSEDTEYVHRAKERLLQLHKKFEVFVLTAQAEAYNNDTFKKAFKKVYEKGKDDDINQLFSDIKEAAKKQLDTQIRQQFNRVFEVCTERYIGEFAGQDLLNLLKVDDGSNIDNNLNTTRNIIEDLFVAFNKFGLLPIAFISPNVSLNESSKFLAGKKYDGTFLIEKGYQHLEETHLPEQITNYLKNILSITQPGSHRSKIDDFIRLVRTPFLFKSILYQLLDVLVWFKMYVDSNPINNNWVKIETESNSEVVSIAELTPGLVINMNTLKGFAFFQPDDNSENTFIPPHLVTNHSLQNDMPIRVEIEEYEDNRSGETKKRVKRVETK